MTTDFKFQSQSGESFIVVSFTGDEGLSRLYRYEIELKAPENRGIDIHEILDDPVTFLSIENDIEYPVHGILASLDEIKIVQGYVYYRAVLVPQLWKLSIYRTNEIYTAEKTVDKIIQSVLENAGLSSGVDFDLGHLNSTNFLQRDYVCQFGESDFDFISRLMENEGIYYYFDHSGDQEKIIFTNGADYPGINSPDMIYESHTSIGNHYRHVNAMTCRVQRLPGNVSIRDYNANQPSHDISDTQTVDALGTGTEYLYGGHVRDGGEATQLSEIRAEELKSHKTRYYGESSACRFRSGYTFALDKHPNERYNGQEYLLLEISHHGSHVDMAQLGDSSKVQSTYHNSFVAIDSTVQFRPPLLTPKPRFNGTMTAFIYAEAGKNIAEIDDQGRFRVLLPFDRANGGKESSDPDRKSSTWIRRATDYVGENKGAYFPLTGGTEVLLSFINGDPDQPIIVGAVPNASEPALQTTDNEFESLVQTGSGNRIRMGDIEGEDRIVMESPSANSWIRIGTPNDPSPNVIDDNASDGITFSTAGDYTEVADGNANQTIGGNKGLTVSGDQTETIAGYSTRSITGNVIIESDANLKLAAQNDGITFELNSDKVNLTSGARDIDINTDNNVNVNCDQFEVTAAVDSRMNWEGNSFQMHAGSSEEIFLGHSLGLFVGAQEELALAQSFELYLGLKEEITIAAAFEMFIGAKMETTIAPRLEIGIGPSTELEGIKLVNAGTELDNKLSKIESNATAIENNATNIANNASSIEVIATLIQTGMIEIHG